MRVDRRPRTTNRRHGLPIQDRILLSVRFRSATGCWEWEKSRLLDGYGIIRIDGRNVLAHRASYEAFRGPISAEMVCHTCDNPPCCNPWHLFLGDNSANQKDRVLKGRWAPPVDLRGSRHPKSKLTEDDVLAIRQRFSVGESQSTLARVFGVSQSMISLIVLRKKWAHI